MHLTIYVGNKPFFIAEQLDERLETYLADNKTITTSSLDPQKISASIEALEKGNVPAIILVNQLEPALNAFKTNFKVIQAAGGLVHTPEKELLLIYRRKKWDLPKGKLDEGENLPTCAIREVQEETGLQEIDLKEHLCTTYHTYYQDDLHILKESFWYRMETGSAIELKPQLEEDIEECKWVALEDLPPYLDNTHPSIITVLKTGVDKLSS